MSFPKEYIIMDDTVAPCSCGGQYKEIARCKCPCMEFILQCNKCNTKAKWLPECAWKRKK